MPLQRHLVRCQPLLRHLISLSLSDSPLTSRTTKYGCPTYELTSPSTWSFTAVLWYAFLLFIAYMSIGCILNVMRQEATVGWDAMPNRDFWEHRVCRRFLPESVQQRIGLQVGAGDVRFERFPMKADE